MTNCQDYRDGKNAEREIQLDHKRKQVEEFMKQIVNTARLTNQKYNQDTMLHITFIGLKMIKEKVFADCKEDDTPYPLKASGGKWAKQMKKGGR